MIFRAARYLKPDDIIFIGERRCTVVSMTLDRHRESDYLKIIIRTSADEQIITVHQSDLVGVMVIGEPVPVLVTIQNDAPATSELVAANHWQLYSTMPGWEAIETLLDSALVAALAQADRDVDNGMPPAEAASDAYLAVLKVTESPKASKFGAGDTEPLSHLTDNIKRHFQRVHKFPFGDVITR